MKHVLSVAILTASIFLICCKPAKKTTTTVAAPAPASTPAVAVKSVNELQLEIAQTRWPNTVADELTQGKTIYQTRCVSCHRNYEVERFNETRWNHEIDDMAPKAKLNPEEKLKLTKYILSLREAKEKSKAN